MCEEATQNARTAHRCKQVNGWRWREKNKTRSPDRKDHKLGDQDKVKPNEAPGLALACVGRIPEINWNRKLCISIHAKDKHERKTSLNKSVEETLKNEVL